ncbi:hypothetical protein [Parvularcula sp. IMCC14364]|uniref:hypothetical protein n=1 Tax=Parvularcula sp. IMCC14364 TaxID=3067902 RepID=UPI00274275C5|nr:hypothetical protein [Parvularcula sp. IMCC14364]
MTRDSKRYGFWPQIGRPVASWLLACLATGFLTGGSLAENAFKSEWKHLHKISWGELLTGEKGFLLEWWLASTAVIAIVSAIPALLITLTVRALHLPRGWTDIGIMALLPFFIVTLLIKPENISDATAQFPVMVDLIPVGAIGGLLYWLGVGTPKVSDYGR